MKLIDLRLVDTNVEDYLIDAIEAQIESTHKDIIFNIISILNELKIEKFDYTSFIQLIDHCILNK